MDTGGGFTEIAARFSLHVDAKNFRRSHKI